MFRILAKIIEISKSILINMGRSITQFIERINNILFVLSKKRI